MDLNSSGNFVYMDPPYYSLCSDNEYIKDTILPKEYAVIGKVLKCSGIQKQKN